MHMNAVNGRSELEVGFGASVTITRSVRWGVTYRDELWEPGGDHAPYCVRLVCTQDKFIAQRHPCSDPPP